MNAEQPPPIIPVGRPPPPEHESFGDGEPDETKPGRLAKLDWWIEDKGNTFLDFANRLIRLTFRAILLALGVASIFWWSLRHDLMFLLESVPEAAFYVLAAIIGLPKIAEGVTRAIKDEPSKKFLPRSKHD